MARRNIEIKTEGMHEMERDFEKMGTPNFRTKSINKLDNLVEAAGAAAQSKAHIETGYLKASKQTSKHFIGDVWFGEITFARHPGIFELARGDKPTRNHPEGGHFFFNAVEPFIPFMDAAVEGMIEDYFGKSKV